MDDIDHPNPDRYFRRLLDHVDGEVRNVETINSLLDALSNNKTTPK